jgi:Membrane protein involved in colicin uptake
MLNDNNPWLGLKTYSEGQILYGRSEEINALSQDILFNRQTVVYGKSGIGKSSLLNAGVFPILRRANMFPVNVRLVHNDKQTDYCEQIRKSVEESLNNLRRDIVGTDGRKQTLDSLLGRKEELCSTIPNDKGESLWEYFHRHVFFDDLGNEIQPVIAFDQFEEIFTLCKDEDTRKEFFDQLADLINDIPPSYIYASNEESKGDDSGMDEVIDGSEDFVLEEDDENEQTYNYLQEPKYHIIITLREDFLSYLERYTTNIPLLKHNRYCLRPLSDDQASTIITDPVPGLISEEVAVEIICKITDSEPNEFKLGDGIAQLEVDSAILSLFLSELYKKKAPEDTTISKELVQAIGDNIITSFYEETIAGISEKSAEYLERRLVTDDERRDSIFEDRALSRGVTREELKYLKDERLIHEFPWNDDGMRIEFMHDILCPIIVDRRKKREQKRLQEEEARKREEETKRKEEEAQRRIQEEERKRKEVERKAEEDKRKLIEEAKQIRKKNRRRIVALISIMLLVVGLTGVGIALYYFATKHVFEEYYQSYTLENGWPKGIGEPLSKEEAYNLSISYRLWKEGFLAKHLNHVSIYGRGGQQIVAKNPISSIIVCEEDDQGNDKKASGAVELMHRTHYIYFRQDSELDEPVQMLCYDKEGKDKVLLYSINLSKEGEAVWTVFYDPEGKPLPMRDNGADRVKILRGNSGLDSLCYIYDSQGVPQSNQACIPENNYIPFYGQELKYNHDIRVDSIFFLDEFGQRHKVASFKYPARQSSVISIDSIASEGLRHILSIKRDYDNHGDCIIETFYNLTNNLKDSLYFQYDDLGRNILKGLYCKDNNETKEYQISYCDQKSHSIKEKVCKEGVGRNPSSWVVSSFYREGIDKEGIKHIEQKAENGYYSHQIVRQLDAETEDICFVDSVGQPIIDSVEVCHRKVTRIHHNTDGSYYQTEYYYDIDKKTLYSGEEYDFAVDSVVYDSYGHRIARVRWDKNMNIVTSYRIEYEGGRESYRYAMGVDGRPIRCPDWECDKLNYYKLQNITKFDGKTIVHLRAIDEYGLSCFLTRGFITHKDTLDINKSNLGMGWIESSSIIIPPLRNATAICYVHLLNKNGYAYKCGLKDGDIILKKNSSNYTIATISGRMGLGDYVGENLFYVIRYDIDKKAWSLHNAQMLKGLDAGAEVYPIYYTKEETELLKNALKQIK